MRIAIISSPRCGNTFLRLCLSEIFNLETNAYHDPSKFPNYFPKRFIFQLHWELDEELKQLMISENFKIITLTRNPLDIFISTLRFIKYEKEVEKWLDYSLNLKQEKFKFYKPNDLDFINWCKSIYAKKLLSVSLNWSKLDEIHTVKYENLISNLDLELKNIYKFLNVENIDYDTTKNTFKKFNIEYFQSLPNKHGWIGKVNNWQNYLTKSNAQSIYDYHSSFFDFFRYKLELNYNDKVQNIIK